jgi:hypothetical protein
MPQSCPDLRFKGFPTAVPGAFVTFVNLTF